MHLPTNTISLLFLLPLITSASASTVPLSKRQLGLAGLFPGRPGRPGRPGGNNGGGNNGGINGGNNGGNNGAIPVVPAPTPGTANCPPLQIFGARETTAPAGFGTAGTTITLILDSNPGSVATAIDYPACGGQDFCGGIDYASSARAGTLAVAKAVNDFNAQCPESMIVLVGYSQGGQVSDNAFCGGGDQNIGLAVGAEGSEITAQAKERVVAAIFMGSPRFTAGVGDAANVGSCTAQGFAPREAGFVCPDLVKVQSYCDAPDPFCCTGDDQATHQGYGEVFGQDALAFVNEKIAAASASQ